MPDYPYADRYPVNRTLPDKGRPRAEILAELRAMASEEDAGWETGKCSGTMYCGDHSHYDFINEAFSLYSHMNVLQRDMCPSATRFEGEIIAMTLDMLHTEAVTGSQPVGLVTSGGTGSIFHAMLGYREQGTAAGKTRPNVVKPETAHPAFDKSCHILGVELRRVPVDPQTTQADVAAMAAAIDENTVAIIGSACNYGYGTIDPIEELSALAVERGVGLHVDGCLGGWILPFGQELGYDIPVFDFRLPGVTTISADTHKYGYTLKGTSVLAFRDKALRNGQYFYLSDWSGGKYCSPGTDGSRSGGLLAATWASIVSLGREGYLEYARRIFATADAMKDAVRSHPELRIIGSPTFCFSFTSDDFDIYLVNDFMRTRGWRFNGQQYPNSIHMAVTRPQTQDGVAATFAADLADAVAYAVEHKDEPAKSGAIYGSVAGGWTHEAGAFIEAIMADMMDNQQALPGLTMGDVCITIDLGTGGPKVGFVTTRGEVLWARHYLVDTLRLADGGAEQDAAEWWSLVKQGVAAGIGDGACEASRVGTVAVTGQWASTVSVDANGDPVGPVQMWMDTRGGKLVRAKTGGPVAGYRPKVVWEYVRRSGGAPSHDGADPVGHRLWLREQRPDVFEKARWFLEPVDYLTMCFTRTPAASAASMIASWVCDIRDPAVTTYDPVLCGLGDVPVEKLPPLCTFGSVVGEVAPAIADELGLPKGVQVVTGSPDLHSAAYGAGAIRDLEAHLAVSTTSWVSAPFAKKKTDVIHSMASVPGLTPDRYMVANSQECAGRAFQWFRDAMREFGTDLSYDDLTASAAEAPPGSRGVVFTPWLDGERAPIADRKARGGFYNVGLAAGRSEMARAVLEGVAFNVRWLTETFDKFVGTRTDSIRMIGGGAQSDLWCSIFADVFGRTMEQVADPLYCGLRGAALMAGIAVGDVRRDEVRALVPVAKVHRPNAANREVYDAMFEHFPGLYNHNKKMFGTLNSRRKKK